MTDVARLLRSRRFTFIGEAELQGAIATLLGQEGIVFERERQLGAAGRIDFYLPDIREAEALRMRAARHLERVVEELGRATEALGVEVAMPEIPAAASPAPTKAASKPNHRPDVGGNGRLPKGERKVLAAIVRHSGGVTRKQLAILTGYRRSTRDAYLQRLGAAGLTEQSGDRFTATAAGAAAVSDVDPLPTGAALREHWLRELPAGERTILEMLCDAYPGALERSTIGETTEYARSSRDAYIQRLAARQLVETVGRGEVRATTHLFDGPQ